MNNDTPLITDMRFGRSNDPHRYDDILHIPRPVSANHPPMSMVSRAAQFSPFAALTGYEGEINEAKRLTDRQVFLDEDTINILDMKFQILMEHLDEHPVASFTYYVPDERKSGGAYITVSNSIKKFDSLTHSIIFTDNTSIAIKDITDITSDLFNIMDPK